VAEAPPPGGGEGEAEPISEAFAQLRAAVTRPRPPGERSVRRLGAEELRLPGEVSSTATARRWIAVQLAGLPEDLVEAAVLLVSELVTNAVLHAGTQIALAVHFGDDRVRVDVADGSPVTPLPRGYGPEATTGRGLSVLDVMAPSWGVHQGDQGKVVWFELPVDDPAVTGAHAVAGGARWPTVGTVAGAAGPARAVVLLDVPPAVLAATAEHYEALFRELRLIAEQAADASRVAPAGLLAVIEPLGTWFAPLLARAAEDHGDTRNGRGDVRLELPPDAVGVTEEYGRWLDVGDAACAAGELVTLPASAEELALRRFVLDELVGQQAARPPVSWLASRWSPRPATAGGPR